MSNVSVDLPDALLRRTPARLNCGCAAVAAAPGALRLVVPERHRRAGAGR